MIDISCCSCASSALLITYPIFYRSQRAQSVAIACAGTLRKTCLEVLRNKGAATRRWPSRPQTPFSQCYTEKSYSGRTKVMLILLWRKFPTFNAMLHWKKLLGRRSTLSGIWLISDDSWIWHRLVIDISCCSCAFVWSYVNSSSEGNPRLSAQCYTEKSYSGRTKVMLILLLKEPPAFQHNATLEKATAAGQKLC